MDGCSWGSQTRGMLELLLTWPLVLGEREVMEADAVPMADTKCHSEASQSQWKSSLRLRWKPQSKVVPQPGQMQAPCLSVSWKPLTSSVYLA